MDLGLSTAANGLRCLDLNVGLSLLKKIWFDFSIVPAFKIKGPLN